ncbi:hypothetical protein [Cloacibacillus evryensis]|uniref:hypothetical protein n=1 Tax=Cloacibacillus evryensis TaxID=508460 RepID=UPI0026727736|nr:hypothetical protein [Cloacibacillus evryensis]
MKKFAKDSAFERAGIPCLIWVGVISMILNNIIYPVMESACGIQISPVPLPTEYWGALPWIIGAIMGKKACDKYTRRSNGEMEEIDDADWNKPHP